MSRYYGYDIIEALESRLGDSTYGINAQIETINTTRSIDAPLVTGIYSDTSPRQYPECYIDLDDSELTIEELSSNIELTTEEYPIVVTTIIREGDLTNKKINKYCEIHIEALLKCLHGYSTTYITWIACTGAIRGDLYDKAKNTFKMCGVRATVRIN